MTLLLSLKNVVDLVEKLTEENYKNWRWACWDMSRHDMFRVMTWRDKWNSCFIRRPTAAHTASDTSICL